MKEERTQVRACARNVRISARKARLVVDHVRGRSVPEARTILAFMTRAAAHDVDKLLRSAVANAESNLRWNGDDLWIASATVDEGPTLKRWRPRARGRPGPILKRSCHITITLEPAVGMPQELRTTPSRAASAERPARRVATRRKKAAA